MNRYIVIAALLAGTAFAVPQRAFVDMLRAAKQGVSDAFLALELLFADNALDTSGNSRHATLLNGATITDGFLSLTDSTNKHARVTDFDYNRSNLTVMVWLQRTNLVAGRTIAAHYQTTTTNRSWSLQIADAGWSGSGNDDFGVILSEDGTLGAGKFISFWHDAGMQAPLTPLWYHVGFSFDSGRIRLIYQGTNGVPSQVVGSGGLVTVGTSTFSTVHNANAFVSIGAINVAASNAPVNQLPARFGKFKMYERLLSDAEIAAYYAEGPP